MSKLNDQVLAYSMRVCVSAQLHTRIRDVVHKPYCRSFGLKFRLAKPPAGGLGQKGTFGNLDTVDFLGIT